MSEMKRLTPAEQRHLERVTTVPKPPGMIYLYLTSLVTSSLIFVIASLIGPLDWAAWKAGLSQWTWVQWTAYVVTMVAIIVVHNRFMMWSHNYWEKRALRALTFGIFLDFSVRRGDLYSPERIDLGGWEDCKPLIDMLHLEHGQVVVHESKDETTVIVAGQSFTSLDLPLALAKAYDRLRVKDPA